MQTQVEEIILLPTNDGRKQQNENEKFLIVQSNPHDDEDGHRIFKR